MFKTKLLILVLLTLSSFASEATPKINKAVFDCSAKELSFIASRLRLIERTSQDFSTLKQKSDFVLTVHSHCTPIVSRDAAFLSPDKDAKLIANIHKQLKKLILEYNVEVRACEIALEAFGIEKEDLIEGVKTTSNSIMDVIQLQNDGYALFPLIN
ncbi:MAG: DsrE family protein [Helicobacteraceae bacterium]|nr:DsrE family protein [Helicobacteraceae bacterium]